VLVDYVARNVFPILYLRVAVLATAQRIVCITGSNCIRVSSQDLLRFKLVKCEVSLTNDTWDVVTLFCVPCFCVATYVCARVLDVLISVWKVHKPCILVYC